MRLKSLFIHVAAHDIVVVAQEGRIRSAERTEVHLKETILSN